jgi:gamma-glutamyltranspeptidase/glutathione hydrolase
VAAPHQLATAAGLRMLHRGGNAIDAMVAVNAALGVLYPHMTGPGGDAFWLIYSASERRVYALNASGRAAAAATRQRYQSFGRTIPPYGVMSALTVPGAVDGWCQAQARFGRLPLRESLAPAIEYARDGFPLAPGVARAAASAWELLRSVPDTAATLLRADGSPPRPLETVRNPRLARTLSLLAEQGAEAFYRGPIALQVGEFMRRHGGVLCEEDFARHRSDWVEPIEVKYRGRRVVNLPPNSQGLAALQILGILDRFDSAELAGDSEYFLDLHVRTAALAYEDRDRYLTDPEFAVVPVEHLLSESHLNGLARAVRERVQPRRRRGAVPGGDTTFSCCVDAEGNAVGVIQSVYYGWGSGVVAGETGLLLHNRGCYFSLDPSHPNRLEPGKRTFHTLAAGLLLGPDGVPELVYGTMGADAQPQIQAAVVTRVLDQHKDVQAAIDAPRWVYSRAWGRGRGGVRLEGRFGAELAQRLRENGHEDVGLLEKWSDLMGHAQAIQVFPDRLEAGADPRADGVAMGY